MRNDRALRPAPLKRKGENRNVVEYEVWNNAGERVLVKVAKKNEGKLQEYMNENGLCFGKYYPECSIRPEREFNFTKFMEKAVSLGFPRFANGVVQEKIRYMQEKTWQFNLRIGIESEADLYEYLKPMQNRNSYIKMLIREDMERTERRRKKLEK